MVWDTYLKDVLMWEFKWLTLLRPIIWVLGLHHGGKGLTSMDTLLNLLLRGLLLWAENVLVKTGHINPNLTFWSLNCNWLHLIRHGSQITFLLWEYCCRCWTHRELTVYHCRIHTIWVGFLVQLETKCKLRVGIIIPCIDLLDVCLHVSHIDIFIIVLWKVFWSSLGLDILFDHGNLLVVI